MLGGERPDELGNCGKIGIEGFFQELSDNVT
jgi:hypothetical protein